MRNLSVLAAIGLMSASGLAQAEVSSTWALTSDYDFRGFSQTEEDPALQGSIDFSTDSGWYLGAWASNVNFGPGDPNVEVDFYTGFSGGAEEGLGWDVGLIYYSYVSESDFNFPEIYVGLSHGMVAGKLWYSNDFGNTDEGAIYLEGNLDVPLPNSFSVKVHAGYSDGDGIEAAYGVSSYLDYSLGFGYTAGNYDLSLKYVSTDINNPTVGRPDKGRVLFAISTAFPRAQ